jgi:hypothetical protein
VAELRIVADKKACNRSALAVVPKVFEELSLHNELNPLAIQT